MNQSNQISKGEETPKVNLTGPVEWSAKSINSLLTSWEKEKLYVGKQQIVGATT